MHLDVARALQASGEEIPFALSEPCEPIDWDGETLRFVSPVDVRGHTVSAREEMWVSATVSARMARSCASCLGEAEYDVEAPLTACFSHTPDPEDPDVFAFEGHTLSLYDAAVGALLLEMPMRALCKPDCLGLCPTCGVNRNLTTCSCQKELPSKQPFSALASLLIQDEEV